MSIYQISQIISWTWPIFGYQALQFQSSEIKHLYFWLRKMEVIMSKKGTARCPIESSQVLRVYGDANI